MLKKLTGGIVSAMLLASSTVSALPAGVMMTANAADGKFNYVDSRQVRSLTGTEWSGEPILP